MKEFFGREYELSLFKDILQKPTASIMVYGKRKVGKTTLITKALEKSTEPVVYFECVKSTLQDNIDCFVKELVRMGIIPVSLNFKSFADVFAHLNSLNKTINVVIDEYPYLKEMTSAKTVDSQFQSIIDNYISNIRLFISGSHIGMMKDMLAEKNALYGRFTLTLQLKELNYKEAARFYPKKSVYEKVAFYSVFGGSPYINGFIDASKDLRENVINTILNPTSPVFNYAEHLLILDYTNTINAERIMHAIANGKKKYSEIEDILDMKTNGLLSKQISTLLDMEIVSKNFPINRPDDKKKAYYELCDNLLRFYYCFVYKNKSALTMLGAQAFYDEYIKKSITTFISYRFEEICKTYFSLRAKAGTLRGVKNIGTYYFDDAATKTNGEFDVVLQREDAYDIYEVKYYYNILTSKEMEVEASKIFNVKGLTLGKCGFISVSGFETENSEYELIDGKELYL